MSTTPIGRRSGLRTVAEVFGSPGKFLITGHLHPDGDALGSALALARFLNNAGHQAFFTAEKTQLGRPAFLQGCELILSPADALKKPCTAWIALDCATRERLPEPLREPSTRARIINIDHHAGNTRYGELNWIDPNASCTGELVWKLARFLKWPFDTASAEALWVSLITDTGRLAHENTSPAALRFGAHLLTHRVRTSFISERLFNSFSSDVLQLKRRALDSLASWFNGRVAHIHLTRADYHATRTTNADADDFIEIPRSLDTARVALFFYETPTPGTRLSIRTCAPLDATRLATRFGGGGHTRAAGCTLDMPLDAAMRTIQTLLPDCFNDELNP